MRKILVAVLAVSFLSLSAVALNNNGGGKKKAKKKAKTEAKKDNTCDPKNCDPKNCDPKNCDPKTCEYTAAAKDTKCPSTCEKQ